MAQATMSHCSTDRQTARFCNDFHAQLFLTGSAACAGLPAWTAPAPALDPGGASRRRSLGVLRLRALRRLRALVPRGGYGDRPVHDLLLRRVDRAPRLRPLARTLHGKVKNRISFEMFFHLEHHLFPKVPTCHLSRLADRLDSAAPELQAHQVF